MEPAAAATPDSAERPDAPLWRGCLRGLRGALPPDVRREAAALVALAGPVVSARPRAPRRRPGPGAPQRPPRAAGLGVSSCSPSLPLGSSWRS